MIGNKRRMKMMLTFTLLMIPGALSFSVTGYTGGEVTITCQYDRGYTTNAKYFVSTLVTTSSSSYFAKIQSAFTSASPMTSSDSLMIMSLSVVLVLIIIGLLMLTVILCKRHQTAVTRSHAGPVNKERISQGFCDYTEIKDIRRVEVCSTDCPNMVYATAQLPKIPSGAPDTVYSTAQLPTIQFDSFTTVYAEVKQP